MEPIVVYGGKSETPLRVGDAWVTRVYDETLEPQNMSFAVPLQFQVKHTLDGTQVAQSWAHLRINTMWYSNEERYYVLREFEGATRRVTLAEDNAAGTPPRAEETRFYFVPVEDPTAGQASTPISGVDVVVGVISNAVPVFDDDDDSVVSHYKVFVTIEGPVDVRWFFISNLRAIDINFHKFLFQLKDFAGRMQLQFNEVVNDTDERLRKAFLKRLCKDP